MGDGWQRLLLWATAGLPAGDGFVWLSRGLRGHLGDTACSARECGPAAWAATTASLQHSVEPSQEPSTKHNMSFAMVPAATAGTAAASRAVNSSAMAG